MKFKLRPKKPEHRIGTFGIIPSEGDDTKKADLSTCYIGEPTANCQVCSMMYAAVAINTGDFIDILRVAPRPLILVDIRRDYLFKAKKQLEAAQMSILVEQDYHSTSGNDLVLLLIKKS